MEMKSFVRANLDRVIAVVLAAVGVIAIIVGWFGVSRTGLAAEQIPYVISGGIGGIALIALGCTAWMSADLQDEWRRLDALEERLQDLGVNQSSPSTDTALSNEVESPSANGKRARQRTPRRAPDTVET